METNQTLERKTVRIECLLEKERQRRGKRGGSRNPSNKQQERDKEKGRNQRGKKEMKNVVTA